MTPKALATVVAGPVSCTMSPAPETDSIDRPLAVAHAFALSVVAAGMPNIEA